MPVMRCDALLALVRAAGFLSTIGACRAGVLVPAAAVYGLGPTLHVKCHGVVSRLQRATPW
jgi:hypothetical protein